MILIRLFAIIVGWQVVKDDGAIPPTELNEMVRHTELAS